MSEKESKIMQLFKAIQEGNKAAFETLFSDYYDKLTLFAKQYTKQLESAEEITSELFVKIWMKRETLSTVLNPEVYLYISVKNACLNLIRSDKRRTMLFVEEESRPAIETISNNDPTKVEAKELLKLLDAAVALLPEQRRIIFKLIKEDGLKTAAVAQILGISKRTVENQLYKAVKTLAAAVSAYLGYCPQAKIAKKQLPPALSILFF